MTIDAARDYITDQGPEVWSILHQHDIEHVRLVDVHFNMGVLGRPFGLGNLMTGGKQAVLVRDLTDSMYNPASWLYVNHHPGTDLIIQPIEKFVRPTMTSNQLLGGEPLRFVSDSRPRLRMVNYQGHQSNQQSPQVTTDTANTSHRLVTAWPETSTSPGSLYRTTPFAEAARPLLWGSIAGQNPQPVAWTCRRADGGFSFYTSLGHAGDFAQPAFQNLLKQGIAWTLEMRDIEP